MKYSIQAKNLHKTFQTPEKIVILEGVDIEASLGEAICIMGASGEGKTTLLHILGTLEKADIGEIDIVEKSIKKWSPHILRNEHIGFIFQSYNLLEDLSALENVLMPARIGRKSLSKESPMYQRGLHLLNEVGLQNRQDYPVKLLSGGEKQRIAIARALCNNPEIILADEPSGNLDYANSSKIHELLLYFVKKMNKTLILVTHDKELAKLCDRIYLLKRGKITLVDKHSI
ncbi:MAG: ABC transporter ATP-binding protein [Chlamydiota bacterium]